MPSKLGEVFCDLQWRESMQMFQRILLDLLFIVSASSAERVVGPVVQFIGLY